MALSGSTILVGTRVMLCFGPVVRGPQQVTFPPRRTHVESPPATIEKSRPLGGERGGTGEGSCVEALASSTGEVQPTDAPKASRIVEIATNEARYISPPRKAFGG
jgi:hypothetical protein